MQNTRVIFWFRQDLRLEDNPGLTKAAQSGSVLPVYILDKENCRPSLGRASRYWLHYSLSSLNNNLGNKLSIYEGDALKIILDLVNKYEISSVFWNRCYEPLQRRQDRNVKEELKKKGVCVESFNASLLWEPWNVLKQDKTPYDVFTQFYRKGCLNSSPPREPLPSPSSLKLMDCVGSVEQLNLIPSDSKDKFNQYWEIGEEGAKVRLISFISSGLFEYKVGRDYPGKNLVSRLSPYLHFGEISPNQVWHAVKRENQNANTDHFLSELGWREFSYYLLYHFPQLPEKNFLAKFDSFPWLWESDLLEKWQNGLTGYPLIDAGMRQLKEEGYISNRIRLVVASFLVKNLMIHWQKGAEWFWDHLLDADLANNSASWQWVAGSGADAAEYFRIFNPMLQGTKFDANGDYTKKYVPELKRLPKQYLYTPWETPLNVLKKCGIELGKSYPLPIVDFHKSKKKSVDAYEQL